MAALQMSSQTLCTCGGKWLEHVTLAFRMNNIPVADLCKDVLRAITEGRAESTPIIVLAGARGGEGK
eukprot:1152378-Karenia_brevis.AAC.1